MALCNREKWMAQQIADYYHVSEFDVQVSSRQFIYLPYHFGAFYKLLFYRKSSGIQSTILSFQVSSMLRDQDVCISHTRFL